MSKEIIMDDEAFQDVDDEVGPPGLELMPAWFAERMMQDSWGFGLLLVTGKMLAIEQIEAITRDASGRLWLDVIMRRPGDCEDAIGEPWSDLIYSPTDRIEASVAADHVVMAVELWTS